LNNVLRENKIYEENLADIVEKTLNNLCNSFIPSKSQDFKISQSFINNVFGLFEIALNLNSNIKLYFLNDEKMESFLRNSIFKNISFKLNMIAK
jgi:hypothetical protein